MVTGKLPKALEERPVVTPLLLQYIQAFAFLREFRDERGIIGLSDILSYAKEIAEDDPLQFAKIISVANRFFLAALNESKEI